MSAFSARLAELRDRGLHRRTRLISGPQGPHTVVDGRPALMLCSNNYLGLADHPRVREAAADAAMRWGVGAGASRLVGGTMTIHRRLEERLSDFKGRQSALLFGSGYLANTGVIAAMAEPGGIVCSDSLNHASIIDGCRLAGVETFVYDHADTDHLEWGLSKARGRQALVVTDSVFSMDGDIAPLASIIDVAKRHGARTVIDEAHATGVVGPGGRGALAAAGLEQEVDVIVGTLGKSLGSYGAFAACDATVADWLINRSRTVIYSTAPAPPSIAGALAALTLLEEEPRRVDRLQANVRVLRDSLNALGFGLERNPTAILPLVIGDADLTMTLCEELLRRGLFAQAIRPPTVPDGTSRLRLAVMATHRPNELRDAARTIARACTAVGLRPNTGTVADEAPVDAGAPAAEPAPLGQSPRPPMRRTSEPIPGDGPHEIKVIRRSRSSGGKAPFDIESDGLDRAA